MISLEKLAMAEASFNLCRAGDTKKSVSMLCPVDNLCDEGMALIKDQSYFDRFLRHLKGGAELDRVGIVFQDSFYQKCDEVRHWEGLNRLLFHGTVASVDVALSRWSELFYNTSSHGCIRTTDGRTSGVIKIHASADIAQGVFLGEGVEIGANCKIHAGCSVLTGSIIDAGTTLYPHVVIYRNVRVGQNVIIHANTTLGSDGFSYNFVDGCHLKVWHFGGVRIGDNVEIGANCSIDQGTLSPTVIGAGTKIDNQVHIGHNCQVGRGVIICGQSGLAGSVTIGDFVVIAGAANIAPNVCVGHRARIGGMSGVTGNIPDEADYAGHPARPVREWLRAQAAMRRSTRHKRSNEI